MFSGHSVSELGQAPLITGTVFPFNWNTLFSGTKWITFRSTSSALLRVLTPDWASILSAFIISDVASPSWVHFVPHAKLNLLLIFLGPAELWCPDEVAMPKVKPWPVIDGSAVPPQDLAVGFCNALFLSVVSQVFMQAPNAHSLWACWFLTFLSMSATRWTRTSLRHICTARGSVSVGCSVILPYSGRQRRCWAPWCCMSTVLDWADVPHCSNEPIHRAALAGSSLESFIVLCRYTTSIPQVVFNVAPTCQPLQFHPKMSVERSLRAFGLIHRECPKSLRALCGRVLWAVTRHQCCGKQAINKTMPRREK